MYYGKSGATNLFDKTGTWSSDYVGGWYLPNNATASTTDSTSNGNDGTAYNTASSTVDGHIDGGFGFDGDSDYIEVADDGSLEFDTLDFSISAWIYRKSGGTMHAIVDKRNSEDGSDGYLIGVHSDDTVHTYLEAGGTSEEITSVTTINDDEWYFIAGIFDRSDNGEIYVNGVLDKSSSISSVSGSISNGGRMAIGDHGPDILSSWTFFNGTIDEVHISNIAKSPQFIAIEYNNQSAVSEFLTFGAEEGGSEARISGQMRIDGQMRIGQ